MTTTVTIEPLSYTLKKEAHSMRRKKKILLFSFNVMQQQIQIATKYDEQEGQVA